MDINVMLSMNKQICIECGCVFFVAEDVIRIRKQNKKSFYCYNGHPQSFTKSKEQELNEELERIRNLRVREIHDYNNQVAALKKQLKEKCAEPTQETPVKRKARRVYK